VQGPGELLEPARSPSDVVDRLRAHQEPLRKRLSWGCHGTPL